MTENVTMNTVSTKNKNRNKSTLMKILNVLIVKPYLVFEFFVRITIVLTAIFLIIVFNFDKIIRGAGTMLVNILSKFLVK